MLKSSIKIPDRVCGCPQCAPCFNEVEVDGELCDSCLIDGCIERFLEGDESEGTA